MFAIWTPRPGGRELRSARQRDKKRRIPMTDTTFDTEQELREDAIARRAYDISLTSESSSDVDNWLRAEQELERSLGDPGDEL